MKTAPNGLPVAESTAEAKHLFDSGVQSFFVTDYVEETPAHAPHQPGDIVYVASATRFSGGIPPELINTPLTVVACAPLPCSDGEIWELDLNYPNDDEVPYLVTAADVATSKPF